MATDPRFPFSCCPDRHNLHLGVHPPGEFIALHREGHIPGGRGRGWMAP